MSLLHQEKEAARAALRAIKPASIRENVEYGVIIYQKGNSFGATEPFTSRLKDGLFEQDINAAMARKPSGSRAAALCHTHARDEKGLFSALFSPEDIQAARHLHVNAYLATPNGELVIFRLGGRDGEYPREKL
jgi:Domain of unknown function (DUF4329)